MQNFISANCLQNRDNRTHLHDNPELQVDKNNKILAYLKSVFDTDRGQFAKGV